MLYSGRTHFYIEKIANKNATCFSSAPIMMQVEVNHDYVRVKFTEMRRVGHLDRSDEQARCEW